MKDGDIATGTTFRRFVAKTWAKRFSKQVEATCPIPSSLCCPLGPESTAWGTVRVMTERNPDATILSIDGVGACDHVLQLLPAFQTRVARRGTSMKFASTKGANRGTLSCPPLQPRHPQRTDRGQTRNVGWGGIVCVFRRRVHCVGPLADAPSVQFGGGEVVVGGRHAIAHGGRRDVGIRMEGVLPTRSIWVPRFGAHRESRWEHQSGRLSSSTKSVTDDGDVGAHGKKCQLSEVLKKRGSM